MQPSAVVKNLVVWFDANCSFADHVHNICKTCFIQMRDFRRVRQYLTDDAVFLVANALVSSHLDYCNSLFRSLSSFHMRRIVTNCNRYSQASPILQKNSIGCQLNSGVFSKQPLWFISFFTVVSQTILALICLFIVEDMAQDTTAQVKGFWRFLNFTHLYTNRKNTLVTVLLLFLPHSGMICLMMYVLLQLLPVSGKN